MAVTTDKMLCRDGELDKKKFKNLKHVQDIYKFI